MMERPLQGPDQSSWGGGVTRPIYVHYGCNAEEFTAERFQAIRNIPCFTKPSGGFWASPAQAPFGWEDFCQRESYEPTSGLHKKFCFCLSADACVFRIAAREDIDLLPKIEPANDFLAVDIPLIDFEECCRQGIDAIEYDYSVVHRDEALGDEMDWNLLGWDCDSILILSPRIVIASF